MTTIGIDASRANARERTGAEWYSYHLIQAMKTLEIPGLEVFLYSREALRDGLQALPRNWHHKRLPWKHLPFWTQAGLSWELFAHPVDLLFQPTHILPLYAPKRVVTTLHDIGFERFPELYPSALGRYHRLMARSAVRTASRILTVSEFSRQEIIDVYGVSSARVSVTPNAIDPTVYHGSIPEERKRAMLEKYRVPGNFFLYVGRLEAKKNVANILRAFSLFQGRRGAGDPMTLVLAGTPGHGFDEIAATITTSRLKPHLLMPGYVPEEDLPGLMAAARAFVFPGRYEGFGIPILQAQGVGTPVITSDHSAMPETAGAGAILVNAEDPDAIAAAMTGLMDDTDLRVSIQAAGFENLKRYSWSETARLTAHAILDVLGMQRPATPGAMAPS